MSDPQRLLPVPQRPTPAIVLGVGLSALGVLRCLGRARLEPYLACPRGDLAAFSRWARGRVLQIDQPADPTRLTDALDRLELERVVLIPCTDVWSQSVARLAEAAPDRFATSMPRQDVVELLVDKWLFAQTLARFDVPHPSTIAVSGEDDLGRHDLKGYFLKPRHSQLFAQRYHRKAFTFDGLEEAQRVYGLVADAGLTAVLQEYIPGPPTAHYFIDGFVDRHGRITALFARRRLRMFPLDFGNSSLMVSVSLDEVTEAVTSVSRLLAGIEYRGVFSAEYKLDRRDGLFKLLEVNSRPWWFIEFAALCGVDFSVLAYRDALGLAALEPDGYAVDERCVFLPQDVRAFRALRRAGEISLAAWLRSWIGARPTLFEWDDPLPALTLPLLAARRYLRLRRAA